MKKVLLLSVSFFLIHLTTFAQLRFGITGGVQSSKLRIGASSLTINTSGLFGAHVGGVAEYTVSDNFFIRPELQLSFKGGALKSGSVTNKTNLTYLELPVLGVYKYEIGSGKLVGGVGPYVSFLLSGKDDDETLDIGTDIKGTDAGIRLMGGYEFTDKGLSINVFYDAGIANIVPVRSATLKNSTVGLSVTYFLGER